MTLDVFLKKYKASTRDAKIVKSLYSADERSEKEWFKFLSTKIVLVKPSPTKEDLKAEIAKKKIQKVKTNNEKNN